MGQYNREQLSNYPINRISAMPPATITKSFSVLVLEDGEYKELFSKTDNFQRLINIPCNIKTKSVKLVTNDTWGSEDCHVYCFDLY